MEKKLETLLHEYKMRAEEEQQVRKLKDKTFRVWDEKQKAGIDDEVIGEELNRLWDQVIEKKHLTTTIARLIADELLKAEELS